MGRREYPDAPVVGVGAVVLDGNRVLLVRRGQEPMKGEWSLPGGVLEVGETLEAGVCREVREETGLDVSVIAMVEVLDRIVREENEQDEPLGFVNAAEGIAKERIRYHYVLVDFLCVPLGGALMAATDAMDARWVGREELNSHSAYRVAPITIAVIEKAFAMAKARPV